MGALFRDTPNIKPPGLKMCFHEHLPLREVYPIKKRSPIGTHPFPGHENSLGGEANGTPMSYLTNLPMELANLARDVSPSSDTNYKEFAGVSDPRGGGENWVANRSTKPRAI